MKKLKSKSRSNRNFQIFLHILFITLCAAVLYPFLLLVGASFSTERDIIEFGYQLIPRNFTLEAYRQVFKNTESVLAAYRTTIIYSVVGTFCTVLFDAMFAYPLTRKRLPGRVAISFFLYFTMLFHGGTVPSYILNTRFLHLNNTIWIYILPGMVGAYNVFMMRSFFQGLPEEMFESMRIDGASHFNIFFKTVLPLSKPVLATVAITVFLAKWNNWYTAMLYITDEELISLQYYLQRILKNIQLINTLREQGIEMGDQELPSETMRMAMAIVVAGPALFIFPFFQKYFVKGLTVGAVKG